MKTINHYHLKNRMVVMTIFKSGAVQQYHHFHIITEGNNTIDSQVVGQLVRHSYSIYLFID